MTNRIVPPEEYPWWVRVSWWGVPGRAGLWFFVAFSLVVAAACGVYGLLRDGRFILGTLMALAALPYWFSIQWIDRHGSWDALVSNGMSTRIEPPGRSRRPLPRRLCQLRERHAGRPAHQD